MKIARRVFVSAALVGTATALIAMLRPGSAAEEKAAGGYLAYVGTYTDKTSSKGIYAYRYDAITGKMTELGVAAETANPSFLAVHPNRQFLYAVNESGKDSTVSAFRIDAANGKLTLLNQVAALGEDPCYISFDRSGKYVFVANYTSGNVVVFPVGADGKLGSATANVRDEGTLGPNKERQEAPHAHWIEPSADNSAVYVADLGLDRVFTYRFESSGGTLSRVSSAATLTPGAGPRHAAVSADGNLMYVLGELDSSVSIFRLDWQKPFYALQRESARAGGVSSRNDAAEIAVDKRGKHLYTSNRGDETIAVFDIFDDYQRKGRLGLITLTPTGGKEPRHFALDPAGKLLLVENQLSDNIIRFQVDVRTGKLTRVGDATSVPSPVCLVFVPVN